MEPWRTSHEGTQDILNRHNIPFDGMISELFESSDDFDYIIGIKAMLIISKTSILI